MGNSNGYIKLDRKILDWEWFGDTCTRDVFIYCLLRANWKDTPYKGKVISRGSFVTSVSQISYDLGFSTQQTRTALKHLQLTNELTIKSTRKNTIITVQNWDLYQEDNKQDNKQLTNNQQTNQQAEQQTTNKPTEEEKKKIKKEINDIYSASETAPEPTVGEAESLFEELWKAYPQKRGKGSISITAKKKLLKIGREHMLKAIKRYVEECKTCGRYYKNGSTFFNSGYIDYLDENFKPLTAQPDKNTKRNAMINHSRDSVNYDELVAQQLFFKDFEGDAETGGHD